MRPNFRNCAASLAFSAASLTICPISLAAAEDRVTLSAGVQGSAPVLVVTSTHGRPDQIKTTTFGAVLALKAEVKQAAGTFKVLYSDLSLKSEGAAANVVEVMTGKVGGDKLSIEDAFVFEIDPRGPTAQIAISLCATLKGGAKSATMTVPMLFRVKTGRFNFRWMQANVSRPSEEMLNNPDFYADQETQEIETPLVVSVRCEGLVDAVAAGAAPKGKKEAGKAEGAKTDVAKTEAPKTDGPKPAAAKVTSSSSATARTTPVVAKPEDKAALEPASAPEPHPAAELAGVKTSEAEKFVCEGGMVRQIASEPAQFVCLCPGNMRRQESGANNYSCERRSGRRS